MRKISTALALTCRPFVCLAADDDALINTLNGGIDRGPPGETAAEVRPRHGNNRGAPRKSNNRLHDGLSATLRWLVVAQSGGHSARVVDPRLRRQRKELVRPRLCDQVFRLGPR